MAEDRLTAGISPLDRAHALRHGGDAEGALRLAIALVAEQPLQLGAATLIAQILADEGRGIVAGEAATRLVSAYVRRGSLPEAVVAAKVAGTAGEDAGACISEIAAAFGEGSKRLADVSPAPPPLPKDGKVSPAVAKLEGDSLRERAEEALRAFLSADDPTDEAAPVPKLPLFAALEPKSLAKLLEAVTVRDVPEGEAVTTQGDEGREAWVVVRGLVKAVRRAEPDQELVLAALGPGSIVGEMALVSDAPRAASVIAVEPVRLLVLARAELERAAEREPAIGRELGAFCRARMVSNLIRHSAILSAVPERDREDLMHRFNTRTFEPGEPLIREGGDTEGLFLIASGSVSVTGKDTDGDRLRIAELGPGDVVGEISLVLRRPATADVVATHPTVTLELTREEFQRAIKDHPTLLNELYELATKREEETRTVVAQSALDVSDVVLV